MRAEYSHAYDIMRENKITDLAKVGLYGLTYKENVDDYRESPTLQLLESQERHLGIPLKVYDPFVKEDIVVTREEPTPQEHYTHFYQCDATGTYPGELREE